MKSLIFIVAVALFIMPFSLHAECHKFVNERGNVALKCDRLDEYPDHHPEDNLNVNPTAWNRGHQAGYEWARKNGITSPSQCNGKSRSFVEGCIRYTEQR